MEKKLFKYGNSLALILDKPILELLNITKKTILKITTDGKTITITPVSKKTKDKNIQDSLEKVIELYAPVLKKLAKN